MTSRRVVNIPAVLAIGLGAFRRVAGSLLPSPAFGQGGIVNIITKLVQEQQQLAARRRQEVADIKRMQFGLTELGYYDGPIDGDFGPRTAEALSAYRRSAGRSYSGFPSYGEIAEIESQASERGPAGRSLSGRPHWLNRLGKHPLRSRSFAPILLQELMRSFLRRLLGSSLRAGRPLKKLRR